MLIHRYRSRRRGMAVVETALVLTVFCMLMFGIFEYSRFLYVLHITHNAARDGARYASVNMDKPGTFDATDYTDASGTVYPSIQKYTKARLGGADAQLSGFQVAAYPVDAVGLGLSPPVIRPKTTSAASPAVYPDPFNPADPNRTAWNQTSFPSSVAVTVQGTYRPLLPSLLFIPASVPVTVTAVAGSEG
jgi:hypothetical protein